MKSEKLALLGGEPVRTTPFVVGPMIDADEEQRVLAAVKEHNFSRYIGAYSDDIEDVLRMTSAEANKIDAPWHFLGGPNVRGFAAEFAEKIGVRYAMPVNSATSGLSTALAGCGVGPGDEVLIPGLSFSASGTSALLFNSIPVFVDVDPRTFCIDPKAIEAAITPRTKAIMAVHLLGNVCDMASIMDIAERHRLVVIEDTAQAPGAKWQGQYAGSIGDAGVFSFQQSKNIMTGEGGMIVTNDPKIARKCRLISNHGEVVMQEDNSDEELENIIGLNFRMPELCACIGRAQLKKLDVLNELRNDNARYLLDKLSVFKALIPPHVDERVDWVCHVLSFLFDEKAAGISRSHFVAALRAEGIPVGTGYVRGMYENPLFTKKIAYGRNGSPWSDSVPASSVRYEKEQFPVIEELINHKFLWFYHVAYPSTKEDMDDIVSAVTKVFVHMDEIKNDAERVLSEGNSKKQQGRL